MSDKVKISIFTGYFGSGKTEFSINYSLDYAKEGKKVALVDLDIVNPFFRSAEMRELLEKKDIQLIAPQYANSNVDVPSLPASVQSIFSMENTEAIIDVGGNSEGATALGCYYPYLKEADYKMYFVINTLRPYSGNVGDICKTAKEIEHKSRLKITNIIANTNLSYETNVDIIKEGYDIVEKASKEMKVPVSYIGVPQELLDEIPNNLKKLAYPIKRYMKPLWEY